MATFSVSSATQISATRIRVTYTMVPYAAQTNILNDAINVSNYTLLGPGSVPIFKIIPTEGDSKSVDLILTTNLPLGSWTVIVKNVQSVLPLLDLTVSLATFTATMAPAVNVNSGAANDTLETTILKHLNNKVFKGRAWNALVAALASGDFFKRANSEAAFDAIYLATALGNWLDKRAADVGIQRPSSIGMTDDLFRRLAIKVTANKLTVDSLLEILEIYYGTDAVRTFQQTGGSPGQEPYNIVDLSTLSLSVDSKNITITFHSSDFVNSAAATAFEVAEAINRQLRASGSNGYAISWFNASDGLRYLRIYSGARGLKGNVEVLGGTSMLNYFYQPNLVVGSPVQWTISSQDSQTWRWTQTSTGPVTAYLRIGDQVVITGSSFNIGNRGTFLVTAVSDTNTNGYFEVYNPAGFAQTVTESGNDFIKSYRPVNHELQPGNRTALVIQDHIGAMTASVPATSQAIIRQPRKAAYLNQFTQNGDIDVVSRSNGVANISGLNMGSYVIAVGDWVLVDGFDPTSGTVPGAFQGGGLNGVFRVTSTDGSNFITYNTENTSQIDSLGNNLYGVVIFFRAIPDTLVNGPFTFDPKSGVGITDVSSTITSQLDADQQYTTLPVSNANVFPDAPGYVVLAFGKSNQVVIPYTARLTATSLQLAPNYVIPATVANGENAILLVQKGPFVPSDPTTVGAFYVTASEAGRVEALKAIDESAAAGLKITKSVMYPNDVGLGNSGSPVSGQGKLSDKISVWGGDNLDSEIAKARTS